MEIRGESSLMFAYVRLIGKKMLSLSAGRRMVRLRALFDSRVRVPDLADTGRPASGRNCIGATTPGGGQRDENDQAVTPWPLCGHRVNSIRPVVLASLRAQERSPNEIVPPAQREWIAAGGAPQVVGDSMVGSH